MRARECALLVDALEEVTGAAIVVDAGSRVVAATPSARAILGERTGGDVVDLLCGPEPSPELTAALEGKGGTTVSVTCRRGGVVEARVTPLPGGWLIALLPAAGTSEGLVDFHGLLTREPSMRRVFDIVEKVARTEVRVLVRGETGSGKELIARAIHDLSPRRAGPFHAINCAALPATLLESELFGHVRGAFTGAVRDNPGHFRLASGGTLFLDEVGEMPLELQAKLLRVVETGTVIPVGGADPVRVDARIVAATHRSLRAETAAGRFRADLMYRLRVVPIFLPPLRARRRDIALLAEHFVAELAKHGPRRITRIAPAALRVLERHPWPGNVRELQNVLEYAYVTADGPVILAADLPPELLGLDPASALDPAAAEDEDLERDRIQRALDAAGGRRDAAARTLGISRATLWRRMRALSLA